MLSMFRTWGDHLLARLVPKVTVSAETPCWCPGFSMPGRNCPCVNGMRQICCYGGSYGYYCWSESC